MVSDMRFTVNFDIKKLYSDNYMKSSELTYLDMTLIRFENVNLIKNVIRRRFFYQETVVFALF